MGQKVPQWGGDSAQARHQRLWDDYVVHMIRRRNRDDQSLPYPSQNILTWLSWLARHMKQDGMTDFILDYLQPTWLARPRSYRLAVGLTGGLVLGLVLGLVFGLIQWLILPALGFREASGLTLWLVGGLLFTLLIGLGLWLLSG
jgi:hypothetical protein